MSRKDSILDAIRRLPENVDYDEAVREIRILQRIEEGEKAASEGKVHAHEEVQGLIRAWSSG